MPSELTFARIAQLCLALIDEGPAGATDSLTRIDAALALDAWGRTLVLREASERGFAEQLRPGSWVLTERGTRLATEMQEALGLAENKATSFMTRSFTTFPLRGDEALG